MKLKFSNKIRAGYLIMIVVILINGINIWVTLNNYISLLHIQSDELDPSITVITKYRDFIKDSKTYSTNWVYVGTYENDKQRLRELHHSIYSELKEQMQAIISGDLFTEHEENLKSVIDEFDQILVSQKQIMESLKSFSDYEDPMLIFESEDLIENTIIPGCDTQIVNLDLVLSSFQQRSDELKSGMLASFDRLINLVIISTLLAVLIGLVTAFFIIRGMKKTLGGEPAEVAEIVNEVAKGQLDLAFKKNTSVGLYGDMKKMAQELKNIVSEVYTGAKAITHASMQMSSAAQLMSSGANDQAASSEEVSASMEEMVANIHQNSENSKMAEDISSKAMKSVEEGKMGVIDTISSMKQISEKVSVIGEFARRTNILALNAAVEAARAGAAGKGFAVVAAEVRRLAENSQAAADEIEELCQSSVGIAENSGELFEKLVPSIEETVQLVRDISNSSNEQNSGAEQVNSAIQQLNNVTQQNAAGSEEMASSSEELLGQADQLKQTIGFFQIGEIQEDMNYGKVEAIKETVTPQSIPSAKGEVEGYSGEGIIVDLDVSDDEYEKFN